MEKETRNALQRATQAARRLLEKEFAEQLEGTYDILPDGAMLPQPGEHLDQSQRLVRERIIAALKHKSAGGLEGSQAIDAYLRETAFTTLNRFAALKMLEARGLVQQCVTKGDESAGFKEFVGLAPGLATFPDKGYRLYLECLFDEIGREVKVLFDRRDIATLLWPRRQAFSSLLELLNEPSLSSVWIADETIGWVYQYFNGEDERRIMREKSQVPRDSRELAVRNQFFTPRYVVEFLTDNTLGRIWYEMMQGNTRLATTCAYMFRHPGEVFLKLGEEGPEQDGTGLSRKGQEELPVPIPFRTKKDPRDIKVLDPAGGSGHFLLYCYDLFLTMYEEAWRDSLAPSCDITGQALRNDYETLEALRRAVPGLILHYNLHGVDIDPRCAQIASFALWMRAQRAYNDYGIPRDIRAYVTKTNFVVAEPMPGEADLLQEFIGTLQPKVLGQFAKVVFKKMHLAGEAGSLLKIEKEISSAISDAKGVWQREYKQVIDKRGNQMLFSEREMGRKEPTQLGLFDVSDITDGQFWENAESLLTEALHAYARSASNGKGFQRRLFSEDAERGFGFIDISRRRFDVVLMNPPFGQMGPNTYRYAVATYPCSYCDYAISFMDRGSEFLTNNGAMGCITSRSFLSTKDAEKFRIEIAIPTLELVVDLGLDVMDGAWVDSSAQIFQKGRTSSNITFIKSRDTQLCPQSLKDGNRLLERHRSDFFRMPRARLSYDVEGPLEAFLSTGEDGLEESKVALSRTGAKTFEDERFRRLWWEVAPDQIGQKKVWCHVAKSCEFNLFYYPYDNLVKWNVQGEELAERNKQVNGQTAQARQGSSFYFKPGISFSRRGEPSIAFRTYPSSCTFSSNGVVVLPHDIDDVNYLLGLLNSSWVRTAIHTQAHKFSYTVGHTKAISWVKPSTPHKARVVAAVGFIISSKRWRFMHDERDNYFCAPFTVDSNYGLRQIYENFAKKCSSLTAKMESALVEIDGAIAEVYGISDSIVDFNKFGISVKDVADPVGIPFSSLYDFASATISYLLGVIFGRWNSRLCFALPDTTSLPGPYDSLPLCPPGTLEGGCLIHDDDMHQAYELDSCWPSILVDDEGHQNDIVSQLNNTIKQLWGAQSEGIMAEISGILDSRTTSLRLWIRTSFFGDHIKRYSKSRRKAPIYWCISTSSRNYSVWLYYHHFDKDTFYKVLNDYIDPKIEFEERKLSGIRSEVGDNPSTSQRKQLAEQGKLVEELKSFRDDVSVVAPLWNPDFDDGVIINFALLWRLVPQLPSWQKECKNTWEALVGEEYDWAHLAMHLWPERVVTKCLEDRGLAIAHGLVDVLWAQDEDGKWRTRDLQHNEVQSLVDARSSQTVKDALEKLLGASSFGGNGLGSRKR